MRINQARESVGVPPIVDNQFLSDADAQHARYLVKNHANMAFGAKMHDEDKGNPWYSPAGQAAGRTGDVIPATQSGLTDDQAIEVWLSGPFHALPILDPTLREAGFGRYCEDGRCAAVLNFGRGSSWSLNAGTTASSVPQHQRFTEQSISDDTESQRTLLPSPIEYPHDGATVKRVRFGEHEWPNPLSACPGYQAPSGSIILISFGRDYSPQISDVSLTMDGKPRETCTVTADSYRSSDPSQLKAAQSGLKRYAAALIIPRAPLEAGKLYSVSVTTDAKTYQWSFKTDQNPIDRNYD
ncbi:MAG TPA: CAP domain-containing protein [Candidatus Binataceae bacterium]